MNKTNDLDPDKLTNFSIISIIYKKKAYIEIKSDFII